MAEVQDCATCSHGWLVTDPRSHVVVDKCGCIICTDCYLEAVTASTPKLLRLCPGCTMKAPAEHHKVRGYTHHKHTHRHSDGQNRRTVKECKWKRPSKATRA